MIIDDIIMRNHRVADAVLRKLALQFAPRRQYPAIRRVGRAVECTGLENRQGLTVLVSSNLTLSASQAVFYLLIQVIK